MSTVKTAKNLSPRILLFPKYCDESLKIANCETINNSSFKTVSLLLPSREMIIVSKSYTDCPATIIVGHNARGQLKMISLCEIRHKNRTDTGQRRRCRRRRLCCERTQKVAIERWERWTLKETLTSSADINSHQSSQNWCTLKRVSSQFSFAAIPLRNSPKKQLVESSPSFVWLILG